MEQILSIIELIQPYVKPFKMPQSTIEEIATLIAEKAPDHQDKLYALIGQTIAKAKKSSVLKATEICDKLFVQLNDADLLYPCEIQSKQEQEIDSEQKQKEEYEKYIGTLIQEKNKLPPMELLHQKDPNRSTEFLIENCELIVGGKNLIENARIQLNYGHKYGLIGRNGIGKTQLMGALARYDFEKMPKHLQILLVEQEVMGSDTTVIQSVLETDIERENLLKEDKELSEKNDNESQERHVEVLKRLEQIEAFSAPARASVILKGLGFEHEAQLTMTKNLSGGWRMRVSLARALFVEPDILLLDEPTNHLDLDAVIWLEQYISNSSSTVVIVSHDRQFLNSVCTDTIHFFERQLAYYKGNYDQFEKTRDERQKQQMKEYQKQQDEIEKDKAIIAKFRANNSRASMAQCRIKKLEKMEVIEKVVMDSQIHFDFPKPERIPPPCLKIEDGLFYYNPNNVLYEDIQFGIDMDSRIAIVGANGAGKSTLINILLQKNSLVSGQSYFSSRCRVASFTQHHMEQLDLLLTPYDQLKSLFPNMEEQVYRRHLGMFGIQGVQQTQTMYLLSGGQKSRVAFAICVWNRPHILILDEPTNHLDLDAVNALIDAIKNYDGGILIVSHDQHLIQETCNQIWYIKNKRIIKYGGNFQSYRQSLLDGKL